MIHRANVKCSGRSEHDIAVDPRQFARMEPSSRRVERFETGREGVGKNRTRAAARGKSIFGRPTCRERV